jgi:hypothetical protein
MVKRFTFACPNCGRDFSGPNTLAAHQQFDQCGQGPTLETSTDWARTIADAKVIGGFGIPLPIGVSLAVEVSTNGFGFGPLHPGIPIGEILDLDIGGPGTTTSGGGFIGGGFGVKGAAEGMLVAAALNALTTSTSTLSVLGILSVDAEVWLACPGVAPAALRIELAPAYVALRALHRARG